MITLLTKAAALALSLACFASFGWALRRLFARPSGTHAEMRLIEVLGLVFAILQLATLALMAPVSGAWLAVGVALWVSSLALFWWAARTIRSQPFNVAFTPTQPSRLVESGPYRYIRNPFYTSYLLCWLAGAVATQTLWLLGTAVVMACLYWRAVRQEEAEFLKGSLATEFRRYVTRTGRFWPRLGSSSPA